MSLAERTASERFLQAMGPMVTDENKIEQVLLFIQAMRENNENLPKMSFQELESCIPIDSAFEELRHNVKVAYGVEQLKL